MISVVCCPDGVIVRYEKQDFEGVVGSWSNKTIRDITPFVSENSVYLIDEGGRLPDDFGGPSLTLCSRAPDGSRKERLSLPLVVVAHISGEDCIQRPNGPLRIVHATAHYEFSTLCVQLDEGQEWKSPDDGMLFVTRTPICLPVAWDEFEVYGATSPDAWAIAATEAWAERDILGAATSFNARRESFLEIDPRFNVRQHYISVLAEFDNVLANASREEDLQIFFKKYPSLLEPTFACMWPKLALGATVTDFVFRRATGDYLLIELEHPRKSLFTQKGPPSRHLTQSLDQIYDWYRYIEDNLDTVQRELGLKGITANAKGLLVIGRSSDVTPEHRRKLTAMTDRWPIRVVTYDDLRAQMTQVLENIVGPLRKGEGKTELYFPPTDSAVFPSQELPHASSKKSNSKEK